MTILGGLVLLTAIQHVLFMVIEVFFWDKPLGRKIFRLTPEFARESKKLAINQGVYNGFLAAALFVGFCHSVPEIGREFQLYGLLCVVAAAIAGALTVSWRILLVQGTPAALGLIAFFAGF